MKKMISLSKWMFVIFLMIGSFPIVFAARITKTVPFRYNILPETKAGTTIDTKVQKELRFNLYESTTDIFYNHQPVRVEDNAFTIDISQLSGHVTLQLTNSKNEICTFEYYLSNQKGYLEGYELLPGKDLKAYVTTYQGIQILYSDKEIKAVQKLQEYIKQLPMQVLQNVKTIKLIPYENTSHIAGVTKDSTITLYKFSKYAKQTQKQIIFHEIAHTWANRLIDEQVLDYSLSDFTQAAQADKTEVSQYASQYKEENNRYSEDFADSVAFYFINRLSFHKKYPNRAFYIEMLLTQ